MEENNLLDRTSEGNGAEKKTAGEAGTTAVAPSPALPAPTNPRDTADGKAPITEDPYDFERCTVTFSFTLLPADGDGRGRRVVISARNHLDAPIFAEGEWRLADLVGEQAMPKVSVELAQRIIAALPARAEARQARQAAQTPVAKSKAARSKRGQPHASAQAALPGAVPGSASSPPSPTEDRPRALRREQHGAEKAVQLSMFDVFASNQEVLDDPGNA